jgi:hypothetical protein
MALPIYTLLTPLISHTHTHTHTHTHSIFYIPWLISGLILVSGQVIANGFGSSLADAKPALEGELLIRVQGARENEHRYTHHTVRAALDYGN